VFEPLLDLPAEQEPDALWFAFVGEELVVTAAGLVPTAAELAFTPMRTVPLGRLDGRLCIGAELDAVPVGLEAHGLRPLWSVLGDPHWTVAGRARQMLAWDADHRHCGRCGSPTVIASGERARTCTACGHASYPRLAPAIIVLVERADGAALLCHGVRFPRVSYSCLAGFVEPGESLEEAVHREVFEEAGITLRDVRYVSSQPWPFPGSLMVGFEAHHADGELRLDPSEIVDGGWYTRDDLPPLPPYPSIARSLVDAWIARGAAPTS
jgi:NAD+ diphosphatase